MLKVKIMKNAHYADSMTTVSYHKIPSKAANRIHWYDIFGSGKSLALSEFSNQYKKPIIVITKDIKTNNILEQELDFFFFGNDKNAILTFPDWETLPYDHFSPHQDIISQRISTLYQLPKLTQGIVITSITTLMCQLPPREYIENNSFALKNGDNLDFNILRLDLEKYGYRCVEKVMEHGEFAVRGSILDLFPMGSDQPFRIDLFDQQVDSIREFDPDTQRTTNKINKINLLPAKEFPLTPEAIALFRKNWRTTFPEVSSDSPVYQSIINKESAAGIEYFLPFFFEKTNTLFDYLPEDCLIITVGDINNSMENFSQEVKNRYEELRHDQLRPLLPPKDIFLTTDEAFGKINNYPQILIHEEDITPAKTKDNQIFFNIKKLPDIAIEHKANIPLAKLKTFLDTTPLEEKILICAESMGRRETLLELLKNLEIKPLPCNSWQDFLNSTVKIAITAGEIESGFRLENIETETKIALITETELFGEQIVMQRRLRKTAKQDPESMINSLTELSIGDPVVHIDHGIGKFLGLQTLQTDGIDAEFLTVEYANNAKLYIPVASLHLISRYTGVDSDHVSYSNLGTQQWEKAKRKAAEKIRDVAAELLNLYAKRVANPGFKFSDPDSDYQTFAGGFPFEETPDQQRAIADVIADMTSTKHMDRLICGDVGFGKTEVAMRAAFIAAHENKQVVVLAPTTILAQQHFNNFKDRFADWPIKIDLISRFRSGKDQKEIFDNLELGKIDIIIGTHKLLQPGINFKNLGLIIIDEEHRFGVKQKERLKEMRPNIDVLTLTATPIPRTLNMAFSGIRDFSIISTPPLRRLSIKTFMHERDNNLIREAILREISRGGQVYFLHNYVATIEKVALELQQLIPTLKVAFAHGQMREHQLERIMSDFYHFRYNILVCTTIIESGIDVPTANTIIIDNADRFGLAQLHQLRGRVGRSHHQAYAYLLVKSKKALTSDAAKRLDAITSMEHLGAGFSLATHDLEIRGAGELLGEEQSGEIQGIGFSLYMEYLDKAVTALKNGTEPDLDAPLYNNTEIELQIPAIIPDKYLNDVNTRLTFYKKIANAKNKETLSNLQEELIDRFGTFPESVKNLFKITELRFAAEKLGIKKISAGKNSGVIDFNAKPNVDPGKIIKLVQKNPGLYKIKGSTKLEFKGFDSSETNKKIEFVRQLLAAIA